MFFTRLLARYIANASREYAKTVYSKNICSATNNLARIKKNNNNKPPPTYWVQAR